MSQPDERPADRAEHPAPDQQGAEPNTDSTENDVEGHAYTGALQDKNQQP